MLSAQRSDGWTAAIAGSCAKGSSCADALHPLALLSRKPKPPSNLSNRRPFTIRPAPRPALDGRLVVSWRGRAAAGPRGRSYPLARCGPLSLACTSDSNASYKRNGASAPHNVYSSDHGHLWVSASPESNGQFSPLVSYGHSSRLVTTGEAAHHSVTRSTFQRAQTAIHRSARPPFRTCHSSISRTVGFWLVTSASQPRIAL